MLFKYEDYKNRLQVRICDRYSKEDFLKNKIVTYHGDFAAYYSIILGIGSEVEMISSMILLDSLLEQWNVTVEQIHADAMVSTLNFGSILASLDGMTMRLVGDKPHRQTNLFNYPDAIHASDFETPMFCLTNQYGFNGAGLILNSSVRKKIGNFMEGNFCVLPSSIHEVLIVPDYGEVSKDDLTKTVHDVNSNRAIMDEGDILSDYVQWCSQDGKIMKRY